MAKKSETPDNIQTAVAMVGDFAHNYSKSNSTKILEKMNTEEPIVRDIESSISELKRVKEFTVREPNSEMDHVRTINECLAKLNEIGSKAKADEIRKRLRKEFPEFYQ